MEELKLGILLGFPDLPQARTSVTYGNTCVREFSNKALKFALENEIEAILDANLALWTSLLANKRGKNPYPT
eukprot:7733025-Ditylum_brightwellii.AAC.1